jgi:hypothetical protein
MHKANSQRKWLSIVLCLFLIFSFVVSQVPGTILAEPISPFEKIIIDKNGNQLIQAIFPLPPPKLKIEAANVPDVYIAGVTNSLSDVPAFDWSYGCSATSASMLFGYYDRIGYNNMYTGSTGDGVVPLNNSIWGHTTYPSVICGEMPLSATHYGVDGRTIKGHVDDYWIDYGNTGPDPYLGNWIEHTSDCTADFMGTNQAKYSNSDGSTSFYMNPNGDPLYDYTGAEPADRDGCHGIKLFAQSRGYIVVTNFNQRIQGQGTDPNKGFTFANFQSEINAGRPVLILLEGHMMLGYGYNTAGNIIYVHDTWDYSNHQMTWGGTYNGMQQRAVTVIRLQAFAPPVVTNSTGASNLASTSARLNGQVTSTGGENPTVHIYWGLSDGGITVGNWTHDVNLGVKAAGTFYNDITGLTANTKYYYRCYTTNSGGSSWASNNAYFNTPVGAASKLPFTVQPGNMVSGTIITPAVTVTIQDASGNIVTTSTASVTLAIGTNPSSGTLSGTLTKNAINGVATFNNLSIDKVGTGYTLTAASSGLTGATSNTFNITVGAASKLAIFSPGGTWFIDSNHNGTFEAGIDWNNSPNTFGRTAGDVPLAIDWDGDGIQELVIFRPGGTWFIDLDHNGAFDAGVDWTNSPNTFGRTAGDVPLAIDWDGDGIHELAIFREGGTWFIDVDHNGAFDPGVDWSNSPNTFGRSDLDVPLAIDWNGDAIQELAIFRPGGTWFIDLNHNGAFETGVDWTNSPNTFGRSDDDVPLAIDWNGDAIQELAIFRPGGTWFIDLNHNGTFEASVDWTNSPNTFGRNDDDVPLVINWGI